MIKPLKIMKPTYTKLSITLALSLSIAPSLAWSLTEDAAQAPCNFLFTDDDVIGISFDCKHIPDAVINNIINKSNEDINLNYNQRDLISTLKKRTLKLETEQKKHWRKMLWI